MAPSDHSAITTYAGRKLKLTNLNKVIYPQSNITKAEIIQYYLDICPMLIQFIQDRPLTLIRYPEGINKSKFYTKKKPSWTPSWIDSFPINHSEETINYLVAREEAIIPWLANLSALELHPMQGRVPQIEKPDYAVIDLDPPINLSFSKVKEVAFLLKEELVSMGITPYVKTSGSKGLHLFYKNKNSFNYDSLYEELKKISSSFIGQYSNLATGHLNKSKRGKRILIDIFRNHIHNTTVAPYSLRGLPGAPISWPVSWEKLAHIESASFIHIRNYKEHKDMALQVMNSYFEDDNQITHEVKPDFHVNSTITYNSSTKMPQHMLATQTKSIPKTEDWLYEIKWDGIRVFISIIDDKKEIFSRNGRNITHQFIDILPHILTTSKGNYLLDGELVCLDQKGAPVFADIISRLHSKKRNSSTKPAYLYAFDILYAHGQSAMSLPLVKRHKLLEQSLVFNSYVRQSTVFEDGEQLLQAAKSADLEGIMCKHKKAKYEAGTRSNHWVKYKFRDTARCMIIGYTLGKGDRVALPGSFHLVEFNDAEGNYTYRGRVGTGFTQSTLTELMELMNPYIQDKKPIDLSIEEEKNSVWLRRKFVCEIEYASITPNKTFREPVFLRLL